jgi:hypothetical protein
MDIGKIVKQMAMAFSSITLVLSMKGIGKMIYNMGSVQKHGLTPVSMKDNTSLVRKMEKANTPGTMAAVIKATGSIMR